MKPVQSRLKAEVYYWLLVIAFFGAWIPYRFFIPLTVQVRHTYEFPVAACSNRLTSDRWTWEFIREGLFPLFLLVPLSGLFMIWTRSKTGLWTHFTVIVCLFVWSVVMMGYDIEDLRTANLPPSAPLYNPSNLATDKRWCLVYGGQPGTELVCAITAPCPAATSAVSFEDLAIDGPFAFRVSFLALLICFCVGDLVFTFYNWWKVLNDWLETRSGGGTTEEKKPLVVETKIWSKPKSRAAI